MASAAKREEDLHGHARTHDSATFVRRCSCDMAHKTGLLTRGLRICLSVERAERTPEVG